MKINNLIFVLLLMIVISCDKNEDDNIEVKISSTLSISANLEGDGGLSYDESFSKWIELKKENSDSYIYQTSFFSWTGYGSVTELKIENGVITERNYVKYKDYWDISQREIIDSYSETGANLGSHEKGADLLTIDDLYNSCPEYLNVDPTTNTIYFRTEKNGLMTLCGYNPNGCMDDCFIGINIMSFIWI